MIRKLLILTSSVLVLLFAKNKANGQFVYDLFNMPDTVCTDHEIEPYDIIEGAQSYNWTFCPPNLAGIPEGANKGPLPEIDRPVGFQVVKFESYPLLFLMNYDGHIRRMRFEDGIAGDPSFKQEIGRVGTRGKGMYVVNSGTTWHIFAVGGIDYPGTQFVRMDFENGLLQSPTNIENFGNLDSQLISGNQLTIINENGNWYGFTFNVNNELVRLGFGTDIKNKPTVTKLGNIHNNFNNVSSLVAIKELDNWHLYITNKQESAVKRISFGNSVLNPAYVINYEDFNGVVRRPVGLAITRDCDKYYGWVLCEGNTNLVNLIWDGSIADTPTATNLGNPGAYRETQILSNTYRENGSLFLLSTNNYDQSWSRVEFKPCTNSNIPSKDQRLPPTFKYNTPGTYNVMLTINEGLPDVRSECQSIVIYDHPEIQINHPDTLICEHDTIRLQALVYKADSIVWAPDYNIDTLKGTTVHVSPVQNTVYTYTTYFNKNCVVRKELPITVSKIFADAGPDRKITDGSSVILGGPNTSTGEGYSYLWSPEIGITDNRYLEVATARPPYSITYYLEVKNGDGCYAIDSTLITIPCDDIHLPNAFIPESGDSKTNSFGLLNLQFAKVNVFNIFDRWGKLVFSTTDPYEKWDGTINGKIAPAGVYVWEVDANCANTFERFRRSGSVTLIR